MRVKTGEGWGRDLQRNEQKRCKEWRRRGGGGGGDRGGGDRGGGGGEGCRGMRLMNRTGGPHWLKPGSSVLTHQCNQAIAVQRTHPPIIKNV